jgi:Tfp pilus assembly protein PilN
MMISINVLPDSLKEKLRKEKDMKQILRLGFSLVFAMLVLAGTLFAIQIALSIERNGERQANTSSQNRPIGNIEQEVKLLQDLNVESQKLVKIETEIPHWPKVLKKFSEICPEGLKINSISGEGEHLKITGFSKTREAFLDFQGKLKQEGFTVPDSINNLVSPSDINFNIEIDVSKEFLYDQ